MALVPLPYMARSVSDMCVDVSAGATIPYSAATEPQDLSWRF